MSVTASIVIDLRREGEYGTDRRKVYAAGLDVAPDGARVIVLVGSRYVDYDAARWLHAASERLCIDLRADDTETAVRWRQAVQTGDAYGDAVA